MAAFWAALPRDPAERKGLSRRSLDRQVVSATLTRHLQFPRFGAENAEEKRRFAALPELREGQWQKAWETV